MLSKVSKSFIYIFIVILSLINILIALKILINPNPFPSSNWDLPWAILFATAFTLVGFLFLFKLNRLLISIVLIGVGVTVFVPIFTIGAGIAYLILILIVLISLGAGDFFLRLLLRDKVQNNLERGVLAILLGLGLIMILLAIQGGLQAFNPQVTWIGLAVLSCIFILPNINRWFLGTKEGFQKLHLVITNGKDLSGWATVIGIFAILWVPSFLIALAPAIRYDELTYHLAGPAMYIREGGIVPFPEGGINVWLHYAEMLYTLALQTADQPLPRLLHLLMGSLSAILVFLTGRRLVNPRVGFVASVLFFAAPVIGYETSTAYIDLFITAYTLGFTFALIMWWMERNPRWLIVAGVLGGFGLGIKLTAGPIIAGFLVLLILDILFIYRRPKNLLWLGGMVGIIIILVLPWLIRDALWSGDPFYPYGILFIQKLGSSAASNISTGQLNLFNQILSYLKYPFDLVFDSRTYYPEASGGMASALPLLAAPLFLFFTYISRRSMTIVLAMLVASVIAVGIMFLTNVALLRYALPIFPYLAISASFNVEVVYTWSLERKTKIWQTFLFLIALGYLFSTRIPLIIRNSDNLPQRLPISYVFGVESREEYLSNNLPIYDAYRFIDSQPGTPHRVLSIGNEFRLYVQSRVDGVYDVAEANQILSTAQSASELAYTLEQSGYDYILINQPEVDFRLWKYSDPYPILKNSDFINLYCELVFAKNGVYVYRISPNGVRLSNVDNLLVNSGFEDIAGINDFVSWEEYGNPEASKDSQLGKFSLLLNGPLSEKGYSYVYQRVAVEEDKIFTLAYYIKSDRQASFLMQIRWLNGQGIVIAKEERWINSSPEWQWYSLITQSPKGARFAQVYASLGGSESALVDEICFSAGQRCAGP